MVGSFDSFRIVLHSLGPLCVILMDMMTSTHLLFFSSVILSISLLQDAMVSHQKGCLNICSCMLHNRLFNGQFDMERILFDILLVCVSRC